MLHSPLIRAAVLALGVAAGGFFAGAGFARAHLGDRYVSVKGIAEREARAISPFGHCTSSSAAMTSRRPMLV